MPHWDYKCTGCERTKTLLFASVAERDRAERDGLTCETCPFDGYVRQASAPNFALKGAGFHVNDYPKGD